MNLLLNLFVIIASNFLLESINAPKNILK